MGSICENICFIFTGYQGKVKLLKLIQTFNTHRDTEY